MTKIQGTFCEIRKSGAFDKRSLRWKKSGKAWIMVGCPRGRWAPRNERCKVGMRARVILKPAHGACPRGSHRITKG